MSDTPTKPVPRALAVSGALAFSSAGLWAVWQVGFMVLAWCAGDGMAEVQLMRTAAIAAIAATLVAVACWRSILLTANRSFAAALSMVSVGVTGTYWLLPDVFAFAEF